jgi:hypothetical protein
MRRAPLLLLLAAWPAAARPRVVSIELPATEARFAAAELLGPGAELRLAHTRHSLTGIHLRFDTLAADGTRVLGAGAAVHLDGEGPAYRARLVDDRGRGVWTVVGPRRVTEAEARALAGAAAGGVARSAEAVAIPAGRYLARPGWRVLVDAHAPRRLVEVVVDGGDGGARVGRDLLRRATGVGWVYRPNPVTVSGDHGLRDMNDGDSELLTSLREMVVLEGLDGSGFLKGEFVDVSRGARRTQIASLEYNFTRAQLGFEEVSAYHHIDQTQRHLRALGFTGAKRILDGPLQVQVNTFSEDNSYYDSSVPEIQTGTGGVDDAEDGDIVVHEYGHAVQDAIVPGFGQGDDASAIGEGFSDVLAFATPTNSSKAPGVARTCLASWDAVGYATPAPCLRRVDGTKHYPEHLHFPSRQEHFDGEIWSGAMHEVFSATGLGPAEGLKLLVESQFEYGPDATFIEAGEALVRADEHLNGGANVAAIRRVLIWRGLWAGLAEPAAVDPSELAAEEVSLRSPSPIANNADGQLEIDRPGATAMRVRFASIDMEQGACLDGGTDCDAVYLYDREGNVYARLGGRSEGTLSPILRGDRVVVRWVTSPIGPSNGFTIDQVEVKMGALVPDAGVPDAGPGGTPDARGGRPGTGDAEGGCAVGGAGSPLGLVVVFLFFRKKRRT